MENRARTLIGNIFETIENFNASTANIHQSDSYFILFDKNDRPYVLALPLNARTKEELEQEYIIDYEIFDGITKAHIADLFMAFKEHSSFLATIEILNGDYLRNHLGSKILRLYEYYSYINGYDYVNGTIDCVNKDFINYKKLKNFYKANGYSTKKGHLHKHISVEEMKNFTRNLIRINRGNSNYRILLPQEQKFEVVDNLKKIKSKNYKVEENKDLIY